MLTKTFILAGHAIFTTENPHGERYTYRVVHKPANNGYKESWFVSLLAGPDNTSDYVYLGLLNPATLSLRLTARSKMISSSKPVRVFDWITSLIRSEKNVPDGYKLCHCGRCGRCGRLLTVPASVESGIGPECAKIMSEV